MCVYMYESSGKLQLGIEYNWLIILIPSNDLCFLRNMALSLVGQISHSMRQILIG